MTIELLATIELLQQENQQLKEELQKADSITQSCIFNGKKESELNFRQSLNLVKELRQEKLQLKDRINKALEIIDSYDLGKYDYSIPPGGIIELREILKGDSNE